MNLISRVAALALLVLSTQAFAGSRYLDSATMRNCGGYITLESATNGDLSVQLKGLDTYYCDRLTFADATSGRMLKTYDIRGTSYTLSKEMRESLSDDCRLDVSVSGRFARDRFTITLNWCSGGSHPRPQSGYSYQLSNNNNCKLMRYGQYTGQNVGDEFCQGARSKHDIITYEYSRNHNCKLMINGEYANKNVSDYFCNAH